MSRRDGRAACIAVAGCLAFGPAALAAEHRIVPGQSLAEALRLLSAQHGLTTVFTAERVPANLQVRQVPAISDPAELRAALLAQHGLGCRFVHTRCVVEPLPQDAAPTPLPLPKDREQPSENVRLPSIVAAASHYSLVVEGANFLSADDVAATPHLADDVFRLARTIPGIAGGDIAAPFHVRGGHADEVALRIDGLELYKPFHLHSLVSALGIIDSNLIGSVDVYTGVQPSRLGGRMSGAVDIRSRTVPAERERRLGISAVNTFYTHAESSDDGRHSVLASARRGYLDVVLEFVDPGADIDPGYYDFFARYQQQVGDRHLLSWQFLQASDDIRIVGDSGNQRSSGGSDASYAWARWQADWHADWSSESLLAWSRLDRHRSGFVRDRFENNSVVRDERGLDGTRIAHQVNWQASARTALEMGAEWRSESAVYDYASAGETFPLLSMTPVPFERRYQSDVDGGQAALWLDVETRVFDHWQLGGGVRTARHVSGERRARVVDPHVTLGWQPRIGTTLQLGASRASQAQRVDELGVEDGETEFHAPEQMRALVLGLEQQLGQRIVLRTELFDKRWNDPRARYENLFDPLELFPETEVDRLRIDADRASSRGIEIGLQGDHDFGRWWFRYAYARTRERVDGRWQPRSWDQPHSLHTGWDRHLRGGWRLTTQLDAHSGWPTTPVSVVTDANAGFRAVVGPRNSERFDPYISLSARISRERRLGNGDSLLWYFEVFNLLNHDNSNSVVDFDLVQRSDGSVTIRRELGGGLPWLPSFGVVWRF